MGGRHSDFVRLMTGKTVNISLIDSSFGYEDPDWRWDTLKEGMQGIFHEDSFSTWFIYNYDRLNNEPWVLKLSSFYKLLTGSDKEIQIIGNDEENNNLFYCPHSVVQKYLGYLQDIRLPEKESEGLQQTIHTLEIAVEEGWDLYISIHYDGGE